MCAPEFYGNIGKYLTEKRFNVAFVIWLLRNTPITIVESDKLGSVRTALLSLYTSELVDSLLPKDNEVVALLNNYSLTMSDELEKLSENDIKNLFDISNGDVVSEPEEKLTAVGNTLSATTQEAFLRFLCECTNLTGKSPSNYVSGLTKFVNDRLRELVKDFNDIYDCTDPAIAESYRDKLQNDKEFVEQNTTGKNMYYISIEWYIRFLYARKMFSSLRMIQPTRENTLIEPPSLPKDFDTKYKPFVASIKTKPFLLLAGISGTGKSKIVRDMARACWPEGNENREKQVPDNFMMIPVRPNWHDSTELIGYVSNIPTPHYVAGPFLRAVVKAWELTAEFSEEGKTMPYFVCLDEMNLAPVEQYFAEYLSVIESRKGSGNNITTDMILKEGEDWYHDACADMTKDSPMALTEKLRRDGISLPPNLIVCGTVNMDETTYAFSRKVLDRAMTIEMNEVALKAGLGEAEERFPHLEPESLLAHRIRPEDYYEAGEHADTIEEVLDWLERINERLEGTPFKIAYRSRNEILLYVIHSEELGVDRKKAFDEAVNMKILPRIEGDQKKVDTVLHDLKETMRTIVDGDAASPTIQKLEDMERRMRNQYYCTYWN